MQIDAVARLKVRRQIHTCRLCSLGRDDPLPVPPRLDPTGSQQILLVLGEAPGKVEADVGEPFRGPAGRLASVWVRGLVDLVTTAERARIGQEQADPATRADDPRDRIRAMTEAATPPTVVWGNVVQCYPERTPTPLEVKACAKNVDDIIKVYRPTRMLLFGGVALSRWGGGDLRVGEAAGRWYDLPIEGGVLPGFVTWHPAAALRNIELQEKVRWHLTYMASTWAQPIASPGCVVCGRDDKDEGWWGFDPNSPRVIPDEKAGSICFCGEHHRVRLEKWKKGLKKEEAAERKRMKELAKMVDPNQGVML